MSDRSTSTQFGFRPTVCRTSSCRDLFIYSSPPHDFPSLSHRLLSSILIPLSLPSSRPPPPLTRRFCKALEFAVDFSDSTTTFIQQWRATARIVHQTTSEPQFPRAE